MYFQQYLVASQADDIPLAIEFIQKQTACQEEIFGARSTQVCGNLFLTAQFQLKLGRYGDAIKNSEKVMGMCEELKNDFEEDYNICASKFYMQHANLSFVHSKFEEAKQAALTGLALVKEVKSVNDEDVDKATQQTQRDLLNMITRSRSKLENRPASEIRQELATEHGFDGLTFLKVHDKQKESLEDMSSQLRQAMADK